MSEKEPSMADGLLVILAIGALGMVAIKGFEYLKFFWGF